MDAHSKNKKLWLGGKPQPAAASTKICDKKIYKQINK